MIRSIMFLVLFSSSVFAQLIFEPTFNLSNTGWATSDYHSVSSNVFYSMPDYQYNVVWGDNGEIMFRKSMDLGNTWSVNKIISTTENPCGWPVITASPDNKLAVLYHTLAAGGNYEIISQRSTDGGLNWTAMQKISGTASAITPQIFDGGDYLYAVWEERPNNNYEVVFSKSSNYGLTWSAPVNISNTAATSRWAQIQVSGPFIFCTWIETTSYPLSDIYFTKSTDGGATWTAPVNITNDARPQNRIYMFYENYTHVLYIASDDIPGSFNFDEIYLLKSSDNGNNWSPAVNITNNAGNSNTPCLYAFMNDVYFVWADNTNLASSDIFFKMSSDGGTTWDEMINLSNNPESSSRPRICFAAGVPTMFHFSFTIVWYDYSTGDAEILARRGSLYTPVELTSFNADVENDNVNLKWTTASEKNNSGFDVERKNSPFGNWEKLTFIPGKGTTTEIQNYSYSDRNVRPGKYIYRLKQNDFNGDFDYSNEIEVEAGIPENFSLYQNYPNPFNPVTNIKYSIPAYSENKIIPVHLAVYDLIGNEVAVLVNEEKAPGNYLVQFNAIDLPSGIYFCRLISGEQTAVRKISLLK
jgi:hypothetical protein